MERAAFFTIKFNRRINRITHSRSSVVIPGNGFEERSPGPWVSIDDRVQCNPVDRCWVGLMRLDFR
jgi:hypothetical protein